MRIRTLAAVLAILAAPAMQAQTLLHDGWKFTLGNAADPAADMGSGTEYFNYLTKVASIHNEGPYTTTFDDSSWQEVTVPHDWAATLPSAPEASHSHGYKTIGYKYPECSVGWYRRDFEFSNADRNKRFQIRFDGIFRNSIVWFNGVYLGTEPSGYAVRVVDITPYIDYNGPNVLCVRADATLEEGWFYEGAGIYRNVWLIETPNVHPVAGGIFTVWSDGTLTASAEIENNDGKTASGTVTHRLMDAEGNEVCSASADYELLAGMTGTFPSSMNIADPHLWDIDDPYLYTLQTEISGRTYSTPVGIRVAKFTADNGFYLNGRKVTLKGVNLHQDHAGVGSAIPNGLQEWRVQQLKALGCNAIRSSHNPASQALLDVCDRLGMLVIDENRLMGMTSEHKRLLENLVRWGRQHPSVILWSIGNEEWGLENDERGSRLASEMTSYMMLLDPTRRVTYANAGGTVMVYHTDVAGFNYIKQNNLDRFHYEHPRTPAVGTEETTGCGTRGYYGEPSPTAVPSQNVIEKGWQYYVDRPWAAGLFYWTGFDYRGESNPLSYPAVSSEFGILDYCGFPKDEAWYLLSWWTDVPVLYVTHKNANGTYTVYGNCDEVALKAGGKSLGRKHMPRNGKLVFEAPAKGGKVVATGYVNGRKSITYTLEPTSPAASIQVNTNKRTIRSDGRDVAVLTVQVKDAKGRVVSGANSPLTLSLEGPGRIIGAGNGDPCFDYTGQNVVPAFGGLAQVLVQSSGQTGSLTLTVSSDGLAPGSVTLDIIP